MVNICLRCRKIGHKISDCLGNREYTNPSVETDNFATELLLGKLPSSTDQLCERCKGLRIIDWLTYEDVRDEVVFDTDGSNLPGWENKKHNADRWLGLGPLRSILLDASCPLCRMIFRVFPPPPEDDGDWSVEYYLRPIRSYNRLAEKLPLSEEGLPKEELGNKYAIYAAINSRQDQVSILGRYFGDAEDQLLYGFESVFALSHKTPPPGRTGLSARDRGSSWNLDILKGWISRCEREHSSSCRVTWSDQLRVCRMIDVSSRRIVSCPWECRYIALSYVWGGISPKAGALESSELPQTIEDAIEVTKALGVDALCIDQTPSPEKVQQLNMMDTIYNCAWATIVALHGDNTDAGLCGVSTKNQRVPQGSEIIEGSQLLNLFPTLNQELTGATYCTRAWTLQEFLLCSRRILFGKHQVHFVCNTGRYCESIDDSLDPGDVLNLDRKHSDLFLLPDHKEYVKDQDSRRAFADITFCGMVEMYTDRRMTNDSDSLNAFRGMLSYLEKVMFPQGFPRRRPEFPSWSYVGWEGTVSYTDNLDIANGGSSGLFDETVDLVLDYLGVEGKILTISGVLLKLEVRNEPFNNAYIPGTDFLLGILQEGNFLHKNTLPQGEFDFLVVERLSFRYRPQGPLRHTLYMILIDGNEGLFSRRSMVRLFIEPGLETKPKYLGVSDSRRVTHLQ
ncbi:HET-domain-containing protein [Hypoxylon crocopeplum]|nr:HET-domain-containing protein [Hypoxylon crocopeplum]